MLLTFFSSFYEMICGSNVDNPEYAGNGVYDGVGFITVVLALAEALIFYLLIGRWKPIFHKNGHWVLTMSICALAGFAIALTTAKKEIGSVDRYLIRFAVINAIMIIIVFFIFSIVLKKASIFAKRTPF